MGNKRIGCLTFSGLFSAVLTLVIVTGFSLARGGVLFSPGPLSAQAGAAPLGGVDSHAGLASDCSTCHTAFWALERMADRCLACHENLHSDPNDFHIVMLAQAQKAGCLPCHTDHRGPEASLTRLNVTNFPHLQVGFSLQAHQTAANGAAFYCSDCHDERFSPFNQAICESCHLEIAAGAGSMVFQTHTADFGSQCLDCHDGVDTYGQVFEHSQTKFPLEGQHAAALCSGCHAGARSLAGLQSAPQDCFSCHAQEDAHTGQFGQDCGTCHTAQDWEQATFDHDGTAFPLVGEHANAECSACHADGVYAGTPMTCYACHAQDDAHSGQFGEGCEFCHVPQAWGLVSFDHAAFSFRAYWETYWRGLRKLSHQPSIQRHA